MVVAKARASSELMRATRASVTTSDSSLACEPPRLGEPPRFGEALREGFSLLSVLLAEARVEGRAIGRAIGVARSGVGVDIVDSASSGCDTSN